MKTRPILSLIAGAAVVVSCSQAELSEETTQHLNSLETKAVNSSEKSDDSSLLLYLEQSPDEAMMASLKENGVKSICRVFPSTPGKEEMEARFNLDKWYEITLEDGAVLDNVAPDVAKIEEVKFVQYNSIFEKASDCNVIPLDETVALASAQTKASNIFNDSYLSYQWNYINEGDASIAKDIYKGADIGVADVWSQLITGDPEIIVAVVDEGVKYNHPDLADNMWVNTKEQNGSSDTDDDNNGYVDDIYGYNFVDDGPITWDKDGDSGHGTHCAGTIAAVNNNGLGVCGVAGGGDLGKGCKIMSCQIFSDDTGGLTSMVAKAIKYAADNGASVISCSFGYNAGTFTSDKAYKDAHGVEVDAINYFEATKNNSVLDGNIAIFASGNEAKNYATYPGALENVISVSAYAPDFLPAYYTNYGPGCNIVAPGGEYYHLDNSGNVTAKAMILSTVPSELYDGTNYGYLQGTSMACPHISGVVALALSYAKKIGKTFTVQEFKNMLISSANDIDSRINAAGTKTLSGHNFPTLSNYYHEMGTGGIDTWDLMMKIEGIPSIIIETGRKQYVDISSYFGSASTSLTYLGVEIDDATYENLGLQEDPYIQYGRLYIHPTKIASGKITIKVVGGGNAIGGDDAIGGMEVSQTISVVSRSFKSTTQGWL